MQYPELLCPTCNQHIDSALFSNVELPFLHEDPILILHPSDLPNPISHADDQAYVKIYKLRDGFGVMLMPTGETRAATDFEKAHTIALELIEYMFRPNGKGVQL